MLCSHMRVCFVKKYAAARAARRDTRATLRPLLRRRLAPDSASVAGLLHLRKLPSLGAVCAPLPPVALHLVRHKRKRLAITPVEVDPDAEAAAAAGGGGTSAAAALCGGPVGSKTALEF